MPIDVASALIRALSFIAMFQAAGVAMVVALFGNGVDQSAKSIRTLGVISAIAGVLLVAAHYSLEAARLAGAVSGMFDTSLQQLVFDSSMSTAAGLRLLGLALIAGAIWREGTATTLMALVGALCIAVAFAFVGHTADESRSAWLAMVLVLHLLVVAFWFGSLVPLILISRLEPGPRAAQIVASFTRIASVLVPGLFVCGVVLTVALVDGWAVFGEGYGVLLIGKVVGFAALMVLASLNKWRYGPALASTPTAAVAFRRVVGAEHALICAVLIVTAFMTTFFSPAH